MVGEGPDRLQVRRVLVTGVAGLHGSHEAEALLRMGYEVYGADDLSGGYVSNVPDGVRFTKLDLRHQASVERYMRRVRPEVIFHDAAYATEGGSQFTPVRSTERNYMMYLNTLVAGVRHGMKKMVLASSMSVYGRQKPPFTEGLERKPEDVYAIAKAAMEQVTEILARVHGFRYTIIRPHNVYGPRQNLSDPYRNVIAIWINALMNDKPFWIYGDGRQKRAYTYITDYTPYVIRAGLSKRCAGEIFNIGPQEEISLNGLAGLVLREFFGADRAVPKYLKPRHWRPGRPLEVANAWSSQEKARRWLGVRTATPIREGVRRMVAWALTMGPQPFAYLKHGLELVTGAPPTWTRKLY
jgi:UDP-glucose 4-epimerase